MPRWSQLLSFPSILPRERTRARPETKGAAPARSKRREHFSIKKFIQKKWARRLRPLWFLGVAAARRGRLRPQAAAIAARIVQGRACAGPKRARRRSSAARRRAALGLRAAPSCGKFERVAPLLSLSATNSDKARQSATKPAIPPRPPRPPTVVESAQRGGLGTRFAASGTPLPAFLRPAFPFFTRRKRK